MKLSCKFAEARLARQSLLADCHAEDTDAYRLFHGVADGRPGLSVDRYGPLWLAQNSLSSPLSPQEDAELDEFLASLGGPAVVAGRQGARLSLLRETAPGAWSSTFWCREMGLEFAIQLSHARRDPQLFLDFRAAKRAVRRAVADLGARPAVLNLFAYTCSVSCHAVAAGAGEAWSADFSAGNLAWGQKNFRRNRLEGGKFLEEDCIGLLWALTGKGKGASRRKALKGSYPARTFPLVVADPPAFSKGKFAAVDLVRDPETIFGPAWDVVAPGGILVAANNSARVPRSEFEQRLLRLFEKRQENGGCASLEWVEPDADFPSFDGEPPLKVALCRKS